MSTRTYDLEDAEFVSAEVEVEMKDAETGLIRKVAPVINFAKVSESSALPCPALLGYYSSSFNDAFGVPSLHHNNLYISSMGSRDRAGQNKSTQ